MFKGCKTLQYLDLSNFNITNISNMERMFAQCHKLKEIKGINNLIRLKWLIKMEFLMYVMN